MPIGDVLDLHTFQPGEVRSLIWDYLDECREQGYRHVRIIHGKGKGVLRETVHSVLRAHPFVASYRLADESAGGWGATLVELRP
jgi:DNA-nicking Smr family endonuclease